MRNIKQMILVVDDEKSIRHTLERTLSNLGYEVDTADSVQLAREKISRKSYDLLITDMYMPNESGLDLIIENAGQLFKVLTITGGNPSSGANASLPDTIFTDGFLKKPFTRSELKEEVEKLLSIETENVMSGDQRVNTGI